MANSNKSIQHALTIIVNGIRLCIIGRSQPECLERAKAIILEQHPEIAVAYRPLKPEHALTAYVQQYPRGVAEFVGWTITEWNEQENYRVIKRPWYEQD